MSSTHQGSILQHCSLFLGCQLFWFCFFECFSPWFPTKPNPLIIIYMICYNLVPSLLLSKFWDCFQKAKELITQPWIGKVRKTGKKGIHAFILWFVCFRRKGREVLASSTQRPKQNDSRKVEKWVPCFKKKRGDGNVGNPDTWFQCITCDRLCYKNGLHFHFRVGNMIPFLNAVLHAEPSHSLTEYCGALRLWRVHWILHRPFPQWVRRCPSKGLRFNYAACHCWRLGSIPWQAVVRFGLL